MRWKSWVPHDPENHWKQCKTWPWSAETSSVFHHHLQCQCERERRQVLKSAVRAVLGTTGGELDAASNDLFMQEVKGYGSWEEPGLVWANC